MAKKILIVEDEQALTLALNEKLTREGFELVNAGNGEDGLRLALKERPDLILLDIIMPRMDGITMLKKLREDKWGKTVEVIILTNLSDIAKVQEALEQGTTDYLVKSDWKIEDVVARVKEKLHE